MQFDHVIFDFDSTLVAIEGIDELARMRGVYEEVSDLTRKAMDGEVSFEEVFQKRLDLIKPTEEHLQTLAELYQAHLVKGARQLIRALQRDGIEVSIITGGYYPAIMPVASALGIKPEQVHAVNLKQNHVAMTVIADNAMLTTSRGKAAKIRSLDLPGKIAFVGDSMTDAAVRTEGVTFIGFGGVEYREAVAKVADYYSRSKNIASLYNYLTGKEAYA